jgi:hypothetical protein
MPQTTTTAPTTTTDKDPRLMSLSEINDELERIGERRKLLARVKRLILELDARDDHDE